MALLRAVADLLFPPVCQVCRQPGEFPLCGNCQNQFRLITPPVCQKCGRPLRGPPDLVFTCIPCRRRRLHFTRARAAGVYDGSLREAIHVLKFGCRRSIAPLLAQFMVGVAEQEFSSTDLIIPMPLHPTRLRERGFNQSDLLATVVGAHLKVQVVNDALRRVRPTDAQSSLTQEERRANVRGAFRATRLLGNVTVLIVDDVLSTGFTASECARALRQQAGVRRVEVLTAAMAVPT